MGMVFDGRRAIVHLEYNGKVVGSEILDKYLMDFTYTDGYNGQADDITITLDDRNNNWIKGWVPIIGDKIKADIITFNWDKDSEKKKLSCGKFYVKSYSFEGMPDRMVIEASALPLDGQSAKQERRSKSYEKVTLRTVAGDVAKRAGLTLMYSAGSNPKYDRLDQSDQTDFEFLIKTCTNEGIAIKISGSKLVLFSEAEYEQAAAVLEFEKGKSDILSYKFGQDSESAAYGSAVVSYTKSKTKTEASKTITGTYKAAGMSKYPVLRLKEQADSEAEAVRIARNRLREANKKAGKAKLELSGDVRIAAGTTIDIKGFGFYSGKYIIESAEHRLSATSPYTTSLDIRRVLGW